MMNSPAVLPTSSSPAPVSWTTRRGRRSRRRSIHAVYGYGLVVLFLCVYALMEYSDVSKTFTVWTTTTTAGYQQQQQRSEAGAKKEVHLPVVTTNSTTNTNSTANTNSTSTTTVTTTTTTRTTTTTAPRKQPRLYVCGWTHSIQARRIFPDYDYTGEWTPPIHLPAGWIQNRPNLETHEDDLMVFGMHGPCGGERPYPTARLMHYFPGQILFVNGESDGNAQYSATTIMVRLGSHGQNDTVDDPYDRIYQIGPYPEGPQQYPNSRQVYIGALGATQHFVSLMQRKTSFADSPWTWLVVPSYRRKNTGDMGNAVVYLASNCLEHRQEAARRISHDVGLPIHHGHGCQVNLQNNNHTNADTLLQTGDETVRQQPGRTPPPPPQNRLIPTEYLTQRDKFTKNYDLYHHYKYCLVMENANVKGYVTEKIFHGFWGGCLPIYYGTQDIFDIFNPNAFVYYNVTTDDEADPPQAALELLKRLEANASLYHEMLSAPILKEGNQTLNRFFSILPEIGDGSLNYKIRSMMGLPPLHGRSSDGDG